MNIDEVRCDLCNKIVMRTDRTSIWGYSHKSSYRLNLEASGRDRMNYDLCRGCYNKAVKQLQKIGLKLIKKGER